MNEPNSTPDPMPAMSWGQLEGVLASLADTDSKRLMCRHLVEGMRKQAPFLPVEETIREMLCIGYALMDGDFRPPRPTARSPV